MTFILLTLVVSCKKPFTPSGPDSPDSPDNPDTPDTPAPVYTVVPSSASFGSNGGTLQIAVTSSATVGYMVNTDDTWITILSIQDGKVVIYVANNSDMSPRSGMVVISDNSGGRCEIPVTQEGKPDTAADGFTADFTLNDKVSFVPEDLAGHICGIDADFIYLDKDTPKELMPPVPSYIIVNTPTELLPDGLMAGIQSMEVMADGTYKILYMKMGITSAFKDLNVNVESLDIGAYVTRVEDAEGNPVDFTRTKATSQDNYHIEVPQVAWPVGNGFELTPKIEADIALKLQYIINNYKVSTFNVKTITDLTLGAELSLASAEVGLNYDVKLFSVYFAAIPVGPLLVTPAVDVYAKAGLSGKISLVATTASKMTMTASIHYDEQTGTSGDFSCTEPESIEEERKFGPKLEGGFNYGIGIGPKLGIYGEAVSAGFTIDALIDESISSIFEWSDFSQEYNQENIARQLMNLDYTYSFATSATLHLSGFGFPWSKSTPDVKFPISERKVIPTIYDIEPRVDGDVLTVSAKVKNPAIFYPVYKMRIANLVNGEETDMVEAEFDFNDSVIKSLEEGADYVEITARATLPENTIYISGIRVFMDVMRDNSWLRTFWWTGSVVALDPASREAFKAILTDIYGAREGEWKGCNWFEQGVSLSALKNVDVHAVSTGGMTYTISLPADWKLGGSLVIANHTEGLDKFGMWSLILNEHNYEMDKLEIFDDHLYKIRPCRSVKTFALHGVCKGMAYDSVSYPEESETIDLTGFGYIDCFSWTNSLSCSPKNVILDGCPNLVSIYLRATDKNGIPAISAKGCQKLSSVDVRDINVDDLDLSDIEPVGKCALNLSYVGLKQSNSFHLAGWGFTTVNVNFCDIPALVISNMPKMTQAYISVPANKPEYILSVSDCPLLDDLYVKSLNPEYQLGGLSVTNCSALAYMSCERLALSSLEISGTPILSQLYCRYNENLTGLMLPIFEQLFNNGYEPHYDKRYRYDYAGNVMEDLGYGFYYEGEPERGYHRE